MCHASQPVSDCEAMLAPAVQFTLAMFLIGPGVLLADEVAIEQEIATLVQIESPGSGYSAYFSGNQFLPSPDSGGLGTFILGSTQQTDSREFKRIVERGAVAVPVLLKHIRDKQRIKMAPLRAFEWLARSDEYDFNRRTTERPPEEVINLSSDMNSTEFAVSIGDLCFVVLGQIVNRRFSASRYQPTGGLIISSPVSSNASCLTILNFMKQQRNNASPIHRQKTFGNCTANKE